MLLIKLFSKLIKALRASASPNQLGWGFALGAILGLAPQLSLPHIIILLIILMLQVNVSAAIIGWLLFGLIAILLDPLTHAIGTTLLIDWAFLNGTWTAFYNAPIAPFTRFNNTIALGSLILGFVLLAPNFFFFRWFAIQYRNRWQIAVQKWRFVQVIKGSKLIKFYFKIRDLKG